MRQDELIESDRGPSSEWEGQWLHQAGLMGQVGREWVELKLLKACTGRAAGAKGFRRWEEKGKCEGRREGLALKWHQFHPVPCQSLDNGGGPWLCFTQQKPDWLPEQLGAGGHEGEGESGPAPKGLCLL